MLRFTITLFLLILSTIPFAQIPTPTPSTSQARIIAGNDIAPSGGEFSVNISIENAKDVSNFSLAIDYSSSAILEITNIVAGELLSSFGTFIADTSIPGRIEIIASNQSLDETTLPPINGNGVLFSIEGRLSTSSPIVIFNISGDLAGAETVRGSVEVCIREYSFLNRSLPNSVVLGEPFDVTFSIGGGPARIDEATETIPAVFEIVDSNGGVVTSNTIYWNARPSSYTLIAPASIPSGTYTFEGTQTSYHYCIGEFTSEIRGKNSTTILQQDIPPTSIFDFCNY